MLARPDHSLLVASTVFLDQKVQTHLKDLGPDAVIRLEDRIIPLEQIDAAFYDTPLIPRRSFDKLHPILVPDLGGFVLTRLSVKTPVIPNLSYSRNEPQLPPVILQLKALRPDLFIFQKSFY